MEASPDRPGSEGASLIDASTGLASRLLFADRVDHSPARSERTDAVFSVVLVDVGGFPDLAVGTGVDDLLVVAARRLRGAVRSPDTVARVGDRQFAVLLEGADRQMAEDDSRSIGASSTPATAGGAGGPRWARSACRSGCSPSMPHEEGILVAALAGDVPTRVPAPSQPGSDVLPVAVGTVDGEWRFVDIGLDATAFLDWKAEDLLGRPVPEVVHPDDVGVLLLGSAAAPRSAGALPSRCVSSPATRRGPRAAA